MTDETEVASLKARLKSEDSFARKAALYDEIVAIVRPRAGERVVEIVERLVKMKGQK